MIQTLGEWFANLTGSGQLIFLICLIAGSHMLFAWLCPFPKRKCKP